MNLNIIKNDMDTNLLKIFITVAENGSLSAAAKTLNYVQSNVTARVHQLENNLNTQLFHRKPRGVILTKTGEKLLTHAKDIMERIEAAENDIRFMENGSGHIRIASTESNSAIRLSTILTKLHQKFPQINIELFTGHSEHVTEMVIDHKADVGYISGHPTHPELEVIQEINEKMLLIEPISEKVPNVIVAFKKGCTYRKTMEKWMKQSGQHNFRIMEFGSLETIIGCVSAGMGRTILPEKVIERISSSAIRISPLEETLGIIPTCLIKRKDFNDEIYKHLITIFEF